MSLDTVLKGLAAALDYKMNYEKKVREAAQYLKEQLKGEKPLFGIVLGTGLGDLVSGMDISKTIPYSDIPNFPNPTVAGHEGTLIIGKIKKVSVIALSGRKHYYEVADAPFGTGMPQVVFPVHVLAELGVPNYFATNSAGGLNTKYHTGDIMAINSHINLIENALLGRHHDFRRVKDNTRVWRFQPMHDAYEPKLMALLLEAGGKKSGLLGGVLDILSYIGIVKKHIHKGTYLGVTGPTYEAKSESIAYRRLGADAVGMSTTPEIIAARNRGMDCVGMSCITNLITKDGTNATNHEEVKAILESEEVQQRLCSTVRTFFRLYRERVLLPK